MQKIGINPALNIDSKTLEEMKKLRTNISFLDPAIKVLNITSALSKEGKSMISFWLAQTLAEAGKSVVLVDGNLRKKDKLSIIHIDTPSDKVEAAKKRKSKKQLESNLQIKSDEVNKLLDGKTLKRYLKGKVKKEEIVFETNVHNLSIVFSGEVPENPSELLSNESFSDLITYLRGNYDYVIVDTPSVGEVTDGVIMAKYCDGSLLVIEPGVVPYKLAQKVKEQLENSKSKLLGVILNKA